MLYEGWLLAAEAGGGLQENVRAGAWLWRWVSQYSCSAHLQYSAVSAWLAAWFMIEDTSIGLTCVVEIFLVLF